MKRGSSHVEIILSFVVFSVALLFALYFFRPVGSERLIESSLTYVFREIEKNTSTSLETYSVKIKEGAGEIVSVNTGSNKTGARVTDAYGNVLSSYLSEGKVNIDVEENEFLIIFLSDEFETGDPIENGDEVNYEISSSKVEKLVSEKKLESLKVNYGSNYQGIRQQFNIPNRVNFGFSLIFDDGSVIIAGEESPIGFEVFGESKRIEVLRENGLREFAKISVRVW